MEKVNIELGTVDKPARELKLRDDKKALQRLAVAVALAIVIGIVGVMALAENLTLSY